MDVLMGGAADCVGMSQFTVRVMDFGPGLRTTMKYEIDYRAIYDHAPDMHLFVEAGTGRVIECNQTLLDSLGYTKEEAALTERQAVLVSVTMDQ